MSEIVLVAAMAAFITMELVMTPTTLVVALKFVPLAVTAFEAFAAFTAILGVLAGERVPQRMQ